MIQNERNESEEDFKADANFRNGVESIPSLLRNFLNIDRLKVFGYINIKMEVIISMMALNARKLILHLEKSAS